MVIIATGGVGIGYSANFPSGYTINNTIITSNSISNYTVPSVYMDDNDLMVKT